MRESVQKKKDLEETTPMYLEKYTRGYAIG